MGEVWQRGFSEVRVDDAKSYATHRDYIAQNPIRAGLAESPGTFPYCFTYLAARKAAGAKATAADNEPGFSPWPRPTPASAHQRLPGRYNPSMWPKAISQLIELAPHITRLVPAADRFLNSKAAGEEASRNVMQQMAEGLRGDLGQVTAAHAGLYGQLNDVKDTLAVIGSDARTARLSADALEARMTRLERQVSRLLVLLGISLVLLVALCIVCGLTLVHLH
jgi:hypothetical protein